MEDYEVKMYTWDGNKRVHLDNMYFKDYDEAMDVIVHINVDELNDELQELIVDGNKDLCFYVFDNQGDIVCYFEKYYKSK